MDVKQPMFLWECQPAAERILLDFLENAITTNPFIARLNAELQERTSTRLFDWIDHFVVTHSEKLEEKLAQADFESFGSSVEGRLYHHPGAQLPMVLLAESDFERCEVFITVDRIVDFLIAWSITGKIEGTAFSNYRRCCISQENGTALWVIERRGTRSLLPTHLRDSHIATYWECYEKWQNRPRSIEDESEALERAMRIAEELSEKLGKDAAACLVLECERQYWQVRNSAGQIQKDRQDRLGMGWGNHDHHTFRSSRKHFSALVRLFEILGFYCRERFYAGKEAGWGAQVMENYNSRLVLFLDVDLSPEELEIDFAHHPLPELNRLGTVGLWCALHGDSILRAGMHHLEAQFEFDQLSKDLGQFGIDMMTPFSNFAYLHQAFTKGEIWPVEKSRVERLVTEKKLDREMADRFLTSGAVGSHLENLQRREGYKGFNQKNVSVIIQKTDPRKIAVAEGPGA